MFVEELATLSKAELEAELAEQAAHVDAGLCRLVELVAECDRRLDWAGGDGVSFAGWLAWRCSLSGRQAREHERLGRALEELPQIRTAFAAGRLSYAKVSVLSRVAGPASEGELLELAEVLSASQLERAVGAYRQLAQPEAAAQQEREYLDYRWADDGSLAFRGRLAGEEGALLLRGLEAGRDALSEQPQRVVSETGELLLDFDRQSPRPSNAEALVALTELALASPSVDRGGGDRWQVVVHVDEAALAADASGRCELPEGVPLAAETARRLSCDGSLVELLERDGQPLALGRKRRTVSAAQRRALVTRDRGCCFPGCTRKRFVDAHHIEHWSRGGNTNLDNLISLCRRHHRLVHERGYTIRRDAAGVPVFVNQYGVTVPNAPPRPPPSSPAALHRRHRQQGLRIDEDTCAVGGADRMNLGCAVDAIIQIVGPTGPPDRARSRFPARSGLSAR
jgi:uncharacterized protein DUF222/HNH endonuclease